MILANQVMSEPHDPDDALDAVIALLAEGDHAAADAVAQAIAEGGADHADDRVAMTEGVFMDMLAAEAEEDTQQFAAAKAKPQKVMKTVEVHRKDGTTFKQKRLVNVEQVAAAREKSSAKPETKAKTPAKEKPKAKAKPRVPEKKKSDKAIRALKAHVMVGAQIQRYAEEYSEPRMGKLLGGGALPDSEPCDLKLPADTKNASAWVKATEDYREAMQKWDAAGKKGERPKMAKLEGEVGGLVELKTVVVMSSNDKITMDKYAQVRKVVAEEEAGAPYHSIVVDDREVFDAATGTAGDESKRVYYYRRGIAGSARIGSLHRCADEAELKKLMAMDEDKLPEGAKRTDAHMREGKWVYFEDAGGKGYKNTKTGDMARPKK